MKSIDTLSYFHIRISNSYSNLSAFWCSILIFWQVKHLEINSITSHFISCHHHRLFISSYIFLALRWIVNLHLWASYKIVSLTTLSYKIHIQSWYTMKSLSLKPKDIIQFSSISSQISNKYSSSNYALLRSF